MRKSRRAALFVVSPVFVLTSIAGTAAAQQPPTTADENSTSTSTTLPDGETTTTTTTVQAPTTATTAKPGGPKDPPETTQKPPTTKKPVTSSKPPTTKKPGPVTSAEDSSPPKTTEKPAPSTTVLDLEGDEPGGGDGPDLVAPSSPRSPASYGNTGGGSVSGNNPLIEIPGKLGEPATVVATSIETVGPDGAPTLASAVSTVGQATKAVSINAEEARANTRQHLVDTQVDLGKAQATDKETRKALKLAEDEEQIARKGIVSSAKSTFVASYSDDDPDMMVLSGDALKASSAREYSASVLNKAEARRDDAVGLVATAKEVVKLDAAEVKAAEADVKLAKEAVKRTDDAADRLGAQADALTFVAVETELADTPATVSSETPVAPVTTEGGEIDQPAIPGTEASTEAQSGVLSGSVADPALGALLAQPGKVTFPIAGQYDFIDSWGFSRSGGRSHQGADIFSPRHTPVVAVESGMVSHKDNSLGGITVYLQGDSGNRYYYAHLQTREPLPADGRVAAGQVLGTVGNSGNAAGTPPHLHFEAKPGGGASVNPYPILSALDEAVKAAA